MVPAIELLIIAGDQVPVMPLGEVFDNAGTAPPIHIDVIDGKFGEVIEAQAVLQVTVIGATHETPLADNVKEIDVPGDNPVTV